jgi:hypothetical protein
MEQMIKADQGGSRRIKADQGGSSRIKPDQAPRQARSILGTGKRNGNG